MAEFPQNSRLLGLRVRGLELLGFIGFRIYRV